MGVLLKYILVGFGIYYLYKAFFGNKKPPGGGDGIGHRTTDSTEGMEGEFVEYEEVD